ncbi:PseG/SpsG family protein [Nonomuraea sp. NPDC050663]|uniref:PseG/SpsG family protein n=1 Tax=Nonomuraea sp. NPDC050663 TaxID=3364370 RepID=UPI0037A60E5A
MIGFRCDAGPLIGVGHLMRCIALAEELVGRGEDVCFLGDLGGLDWAVSQLERRSLPLKPAHLAWRLDLDAIVLDSYTLPEGEGARFRAAGIAVLAIVDGDLRGQAADVYLDQNLGAEKLLPDLPPGSVRLAGAPYVLLRDQVRSARRAACGDVPRVLCFFGGTDAGGLVERVVGMLTAVDAPFEATVISARPVPLPAGGAIELSPPTDHLASLMADADLVVTAAGSSVWELLHLGVPSAVTFVADNQLISYDALVSAGLAAGLGPAATIEAATPLLESLIRRADLREPYGTAGRGLIDGRGRERVADALLAARARAVPEWSRRGMDIPQ